MMPFKPCRSDVLLTHPLLFITILVNFSVSETKEPDFDQERKMIGNSIQSFTGNLVLKDLTTNSGSIHLCRSFLITENLIIYPHHCGDRFDEDKVKLRFQSSGDPRQVHSQHYGGLSLPKMPFEYINVASLVGEPESDKTFLLPGPGDGESIVNWNTFDDYVTIVGHELNDSDPTNWKWYIPVYLRTLQCARTFGFSREEYNDILCALYYGNASYNMCAGDSGSPLFRFNGSHFILLGIAGYSFHKCDHEMKVDGIAASLFFRVTAWVPEILNIVRYFYKNEVAQLKYAFDAWNISTTSD